MSDAYYVVGDLFSLDAVFKPIPPGTYLQRVDYLGSPTETISPDTARMAMSRWIRRRSDYIVLHEWVLVKDLLNTDIVIPVLKTAEAEKRIRDALRNIGNSAPKTFPEKS